MNLATARSARRAKEVGIRKVSGATRSKLIGQFYGESILLTLISVIIAIILVKILIGPFNDLSAKELKFRLFNPGILGAMCLIILITALFAGSYPAYFLSSFKASDVIKGTYHIGSSLFRKILVITQFAISVALIICTMVIYKQTKALEQKDLGFDKHNLIYFPLRDFTNYMALKEDLLKYPGIENVTATNRVPVSMSNSSWRYTWEGKDPSLEILFQQIYVDFDYIETFRMKMAEGRSFSQQLATDSANYIINEEAVRRMGINSPVGKILYYGESKGQIIGIVKNFNFHHLPRGVDPVVLEISPDHFNEVVVRIKPEDQDQTISEIENIWNNHYNGEPFEYQFLEQELDQLYRPEQRMGTIFNLFSLLAILISCMGLFGMASFMTEQRTKEIGIRKTYGSSMLNIFLLINGSFVRLILLANLIAWLVAWFAMHKWLENYAYRTAIPWWIFPFAAIISIVIGFITVTYQSLRAASTNPSDTIRYE